MGELRGTHVPVLLERCLELLAPALDCGDRPTVHVDATLGLGGHAHAVLAAFPLVTLVGLDRDREALAHARARLAGFADRVHLVHAVYDELPEVLDQLELSGVDSVLFDLGVSSLQLDAPERGFAYSRDVALDMRMDQGRGTTAEEIVNGYPPGDLVRVLREYGEERFASRIVSAIVRERQRQPITSSTRLAELVESAVPAATRRTGGNPAKRTFQALRIEVNEELAVLRRALPAALDALHVGGRMVVLSYHSLEDRITKQTLAGRARSTAPVELPVELPGTGPTLRLLGRGAEQAGEAEIAANPRAASVRLRAAEHIGQAAVRSAGTAGRGKGGAARERPHPGTAPHRPDAAASGPSTPDGIAGRRRRHDRGRDEKE